MYVRQLNNIPKVSSLCAVIYLDLINPAMCTMGLIFVGFFKYKFVCVRVWVCVCGCVFVLVWVCECVCM